MKYAKSIAGVLLALGSALGWAGSTDLQFAPASSAGHDFNHAPVGQSFVALAAQVKAGIFIADEDSFTSWLQQTYAGLPPFPYAIAPSVTIRVQLPADDRHLVAELSQRRDRLGGAFGN